MSFPGRKVYRNRVNNLVKQKLIGGVVNNSFWAAVKREIRVILIWFSKDVALKSRKKERIELD